MVDATALLLGAIADDFTGATDLANTLVRAGMRTIQTIGIPEQGEKLPVADAVVVALKTRTIRSADAVAQSLAACRWLKATGARQIYFKYCSTFDSTDQGNIGPVADALLGELRTDFTTICPAFPQTGRTIYKGHLFVGDQLLSDSPMRQHPLTPMTDSNLVRVLSRQTKKKIASIAWQTVSRGSAAIEAAFTDLAREGAAYAVLDAVEDSDLQALGEACRTLPLVTGGSGAAIGLPENFRRAGLLRENAEANSLPLVGGLSAVLSGSSSPATQRQVEAMKAVHPAMQIDPLALAQNPAAEVERVFAWAKPKLTASPVLIYATAPPDQVSANQAALGRERAGELIETAVAMIAKGLVEAGVRRLVVAGGETAGAVVGGLSIRALMIGPQIDPGVPATVSTGRPAIALALKSGNFGADDFFMKAIETLK